MTSPMRVPQGLAGGRIGRDEIFRDVAAKNWHFMDGIWIGLFYLPMPAG